ncbi:MAG: hemolysin family protein [Verrucomicrobiia bacterium]
MDFLNLTIILGFSCMSFVFAIAEGSLFSLSKWQRKQLLETNPKAGEIVERILSAPEELLATIALGNTFSNAMILVIIVTNYIAVIHPAATLSAALFWVLIVCEIFPKTIAVRSPQKWSLRVSRFISTIMTISKPFHAITNDIKKLLVKILSPIYQPSSYRFTDAEYREMVEIAFQHGAVGLSEKEIILRIIALDRRMAHEVMKPRAKMACISDEATVEEMIQAAKRYKYRRLPIYDETPDTIVGILNARALLLDPNADLSEVIEMPSFVPSTMNLLKLFKSFQKQKRGLAIVLDEFGGTAGIITISDILEEVIGKFAREGEVAGFVIEPLGSGRWRVSGTARIEDFQRHCPEFKGITDVDTMGGLVVAKIEFVPAVGAEIIHNGFRIKVVKADERKVSELIVEKLTSKTVGVKK